MDPEVHFAGDESDFGIWVGCCIIEKLFYSKGEVFLLRGCHVCGDGADRS